MSHQPDGITNSQLADFWVPRFMLLLYTVTDQLCQKSVQTWWGHRSVQKIWSGNKTNVALATVVKLHSQLAYKSYIQGHKRKNWTLNQINFWDIESDLPLPRVLPEPCWDTQQHWTFLHLYAARPEEKRVLYSLIPRPWYAQILSWKKWNFLHSCEMKFARQCRKLDKK